jgi:hypothetical protein
MWAHFLRSWSRNAGRQPGASRLRGALTAAPSAELRRGAGPSLRHARRADAAELDGAVGAVRAVRFDARYRVARGPTSPPTSPQPHLDLRNPCKSQGSGTPPRRSRKPVYVQTYRGFESPPLRLVVHPQQPYGDAPVRGPVVEKCLPGPTRASTPTSRGVGASALARRARPSQARIAGRRPDVGPHGSTRRGSVPDGMSCSVVRHLGGAPSARYVDRRGGVLWPCWSWR